MKIEKQLAYKVADTPFHIQNDAFHHYCDYEWYHFTLTK